MMGRDWQIRRRWALAAVLVAVYAFLLGPLLVIVLASFESGQSYRFTFPPRSFSLEWYANIPGKYYHALLVSVGVAAASAALAAILGAAAAFGLVRGRIAGAPAFEAFFRLPLQVPFVVTAVAFLQAYNQLAAAAGLDLLGTIPGLIAAHLFLTLPYGVASVAVVLGRLGPRWEEAAQSLGATPWSCFRRVTLPAIKPGLFAGFFYAFIVSFGDVPVALFVTGGSRFVSMPVEIFQTLQFDFDPAILALSTIVVALSAVLIVFVQRIVGVDLILPSNRR